MILYYMEHPSQLFKILIHKIDKHADEKAVFLICDVSYDSEPIKVLKSVGKKSFNIEKIIKFPHAFNWLTAANNEELINVICRKCDDLFKKNSVNISSANKIYISRDSGVCFENYCMINECHYNFYETICNTLLKHVGNNSCIHMHKLFNFLLENKNGLNCVDTVLTTVKNAKKEMFKSWEYYDFMTAFRNFSDCIKESVYNIFEANVIINKIIERSYSKSTIFGPNSSYDVCVMKNLSMDEAYLANELLLDYYFYNDDIVLKAHPLFDIQLKTDEGYVPSISSDISIEMLKTVRNFKVKKFVTVASSAADEIEGYADEVIRMGWAYNSFFQYLHKYCSVLDLLYKYVGGHFSFEYSGKGSEQLQKLIKYRYKDLIEFNNFNLRNLNNVANDIILVEELNWDEISNNSDILLDALCKLAYNKIICFIPNDTNLTFVDYKHAVLLQYVIPICISKNARREGVHSDISPEYVYIFCKNKQIREKLCGIRFTNKLRYSGIDLNIGCANDLTKNFIELSFKQKIDTQILEGLIKRIQYEKERSENILLNSNFIFGFRKDEFTVGDGFQIVCNSWNTHTSPKGKFQIKKHNDCIDISIINKGDWNNLEQWVNMRDISDFAGKKVNIILNTISSVNQIKHLYATFYSEIGTPQSLIRQKIVKGQNIIESGEFMIPDCENGRLVFGLSLNNLTGVSCKIKSCKVQVTI